MEFTRKKVREDEDPDLEINKHFASSENPVVASNAAMLGMLWRNLRSDTIADFSVTSGMSDETIKERMEKPSDRVLVSSLFYEVFNLMDDMVDKKTQLHGSEHVVVETGDKTILTPKPTSGRLGFTELVGKVLHSPGIADRYYDSGQVGYEETKALTGLGMLNLIGNIVRSSKEFRLEEAEYLFGKEEIQLTDLLPKEGEKAPRIVQLMSGILRKMDTYYNIATGREAATPEQKTRAAFLLRYGTLQDYFKMGFELIVGSIYYIEKQEVTRRLRSLNTPEHKDERGETLKDYHVLALDYYGSLEKAVARGMRMQFVDDFQDIVEDARDNVVNPVAMFLQQHDLIKSVPRTRTLKSTQILEVIAEIKKRGLFAELDMYFNLATGSTLNNVNFNGIDD